MERHHCINPLDSRYSKKIESVSKIFSDFNLTRIKVNVELTYFAFLVKHHEKLGIKQLKDISIEKLDAEIAIIVTEFDEKDFNEIADIEKATNHDIKAIEYYVHRKLISTQLFTPLELNFVHFGLTSQDVVSLSYAIAFKDYFNGVSSEQVADIKQLLHKLGEDMKGDIIIAKTHGQSALPTSIGRELNIFSERINSMIQRYKTNEISAKFGGAIGNSAAHKFAFPDADWETMLSLYCYSCHKIRRSDYTTQTDNYDSFAPNFDCIKQIALILIDLCRDIWQYISIGYFNISATKTFVGSSTMPQKINPIDFENAEGNLEIVVMWLEFLSKKLRTSRLQRDLSDSTVMRNLGIPFGHFSLAIKSIVTGLSKLSVDKDVINNELEHSYHILAEAVQIELKKHDNGDDVYENVYEIVKERFIGIKNMNDIEYRSIIASFNIPDPIKDKLYSLEPKHYFYS